MFIKNAFCRWVCKDYPQPQCTRQEVFANEIMKKIVTILLMFFYYSGISQHPLGKQEVHIYKYLVTNFQAGQISSSNFGYRKLIFYEKSPNSFRYKAFQMPQLPDSLAAKFVFPFSLITDTEDFQIDSMGIYVFRGWNCKPIALMRLDTIINGHGYFVEDAIKFIGCSEYLYADKISPYMLCKFESKYYERNNITEICPQLGIVKVTYYDKDKNIIRTEELLEIDKYPIENWIRKHWTIPCFEPLVIKGKRFLQK